MIFRHLLLLIGGILSLGLGIAGMILPVLPTTPFLLIAAACLGGLRPTWLARLKKIPLFGELLTHYREKTGLSKQSRLKAILFLWLALGLSVAIVQSLLVALLLAVVGIAITIHILLIR